MEDSRLIDIEDDIEEEFEDEEDEDDDDYDDGEYEEGLIPDGIASPRGWGYDFNAGEEDDDDEEEEEEDDDDDDGGDEEDEDEEDYEEGEEGDGLFPLGIFPRGPIAFAPLAEQGDGDYEEEDDDYEEEEEGEELFPMAMASHRVSSSRSDGRTLQGAVAINEGLLDDSNDSESREGKSGNQENGRGEGGEGELNRSEIDGLFCPICFEAWTSGGEHQICCLPCGHIYGLSCIKKWLQRCRSLGKCPQCNSACILKDVRVLYATRLCVADAELHKRVRSLEAKCAYLEQKAAPLTPEELINQICNNPMLVRRLATALAELNQQ